VVITPERILSEYEKTQASQPMDEMAEVCRRGMGYQVIVRILSGDHIPPHAHALDMDENKLGKFLLDTPCPQKATDVIDYQPESAGYIPIHIKTKITDWANGCDNKFGIQNWDGAMYVWNILNPDN
jgi:hypothetical protein